MKLKANASTTPSSGFDQINEPLPIKPSDSDPLFDLQALPSQPLAIFELHHLIFVAHSNGFYVARTYNGTLSIPPRTNRRSAKRKGKKKDEEREL